MTANPENRTIGRWTLVGLFALFFAPLLLASAWYAFAPGYTPPSSPHGSLIDPARRLEPFRLEVAGGEALDEEALRGRWHLVHFVPARCDTACRERLYDTRQIRNALGEDRSRVRRIAVASQGAETPGLSGLIEEHPRLIVATGGGGGGFARQFPHDGAGPDVFLVDPLGNLMMRFGPGVSPGDLLADLEKLLKLSRIG